MMKHVYQNDLNTKKRDFPGLSFLYSSYLTECAFSLMFYDMPRNDREKAREAEAHC